MKNINNKMCHSKKGAELAFNTMIIVILGLIVLALLAFFIIKATDDTTKATSCEKSHQGKCTLLGTACDDGYTFSGWSCPGKTSRCCVPAGG